MELQQRLEIYSEVTRHLHNQEYDAVDDLITDTYNHYKTQEDLELIVGLLRLTFQWREHIYYWDDVTQLTYERLNNPEIMRGLLWSNK